MMHARTAAVLLLVIPLFVVGAQAQCSHDHVITVTGSGQVSAQPDVAILTLIIRSSAPLAADAVAESAKKADEARSALAGLGYSSADFRITPVTILKAGGPYYGPNQSEVITGIEAQQFIYLFFGRDQLKDQKQLSEKAAAAVDALGKTGAIPVNNPYGPQPQSTFLFYSIEKPAEYETQARDRALDEARAEAQATADRIGVQITGLCSAGATLAGYGGGIAGGFVGNFASLSQQIQDPLAELPYRFYSVYPEQISIQENATLTFNFK